MTRKQQIEQAWLHGDAEQLTSFRLGAEWADEHPCNPWHDAMKDPPKEGINLVFKTKHSTYYGGYDANKECFFTIDPYGECWNVKEAKLWMPIPKSPEGE